MVLLFWFVNTVNNIDCFSNVKPILYFRVKTLVVVLTTDWLMGDGVICQPAWAEGLLCSSGEWASKTRSHVTSGASFCLRGLGQPRWRDGRQIPPLTGRWAGPVESPCRGACGRARIGALHVLSCGSQSPARLTLPCPHSCCNSPNKCLVLCFGFTFQVNTH